MGDLRTDERGEPSAPDPARGHDAFVSYSRADRDRIAQIVEGLSARGIRCWVDLQDIPPSAEWMAEIRFAIESADGYLVGVSPDLARSKVCAEELEHAKASGKRIVPVLVRPTDPAAVPATLAALNWIDATGDLDPALDAAVDAIRTDLGHVKTHTRVLTRAVEWEHRDEDRALLARGAELAEAEALLASGADPRPTPLQARFVVASRRAATRRQRAGIAAVVVALVIALVLSGLALLQRGAAVRARDEAERRAAESRSRELAAAAVGQLETDPERSLLLSVEAVRSAGTEEAIDALRVSLDRSLIRGRFEGHEDAVVVVAPSPDGTHLLTASSDGTGRVWGLVGDQEPVELRGHTDLIVAAGFGPDGSTVVTASFDGTARIWDVATGEELATLEGHGGAVHDASFSPDGSLVVTAGSDGTARLWDPATGEAVGVLLGHARPVYAASFSSDGSRVVTASDDDTAIVWDVRSGESVAVLRGHEDGLYAASFSPDGRSVVTASQDGEARLWRAGTGELVATLTGHQAPVIGAVFSPDGNQVSTWGEDGTSRLWDPATGEQLSVLRGHEGAIEAAAFDPTGVLFVTGGSDGTARVWRVADGTQASILGGHGGAVLSVAFSPDGRTVYTGAEDAVARTWEPTSGGLVVAGEVSWSWRDPTSDRFGVATWGGELSVVEGGTGAIVWRRTVEVPQTSITFTGDGSLVASGGLDGVVRLWDAATGDPLGKLRGHEPTFVAVDSWDSDRLLTWSDDGTARLWDPRSGEQLAVFEHGATGDYGIWEAHTTPSLERVLTTGVVDGRATLWDARTGEELWTVDGLVSGGAVGGAMSPDASLVGTVAFRSSIRDALTGREVLRLAHPGGRALGIVFSPDGRSVLTRSTDGVARIWSIDSGSVEVEMGGHPGAVNSAIWSADGRWVVTTADDGRARVFDAPSGAPVATYGGGDGPATFAYFTSDGRTIVTVTGSGVRIDRCDACGDPRELLEVAAGRLTRELTPAERRTFLGETSLPTSGPPPPEMLDVEGNAVVDGPVDAGRYRVPSWDPAVSFALDDGWIATTSFLAPPDEPFEVDVAAPVQFQRADAPYLGMSIVMLDPGRVTDPAKSWTERLNVLAFPDDLSSWLAGHPNLRTSHSASLTVDGLPAASVDTEVLSTPSEPWGACGECVTLLPYSLRHRTGPLTEGDSVNALGLGEIDRWIVVETDPGLLLVNAFAPTRQEFRSLMPAVVEVVRSIEIG